MNSIKEILVANNALSLLLLGQINFNAGLDMLKKLRQDDQERKDMSADAAHGSTQVADDFAEFCPEVIKAPLLDVSVSLIAASLILAHDNKEKEIDFLKRGIKTPKQIIEGQMDWMANQQLQQRLMTAQKFGLDTNADRHLAQIKGMQAEQLASFVTEAQSFIPAGIKGMEARHLHHMIEELYVNKEWKTKLADAACSLYDAAAKRLDAGQFADLPGEIIDLAKETMQAKKALKLVA